MSESAREFLEAARGVQDRLLLDMAQLVNLDSGTYDEAGVDRAGEFLRRLFGGIDCDVQVFPNDGLGNNLTAILRGTGERRIMLVGHFDTVYPTGTTAERPFRLGEGKAYGPGVLDMKGGVILGYYAMRLLNELAPNSFAEITFVANADEEIGSPTSRALIEATARRMDAVLVLEPGRSAGGVLARRKGVGMYQLEVAGRAAHAGAAPWDGRSAVLELAHKIVALHALNDFTRGTTVSANMVRGGTARNVIPAEARADIDIRVATHDEGERLDEAIAAIAARTWVEGTRTTLSGGLNRPPMEPDEGTAALLRLARQVDDELGLSYEELASGGGSDGNFTAAIGVPTLDGLGPVGRNAHSIDEYIELDSLPQRLALLMSLIARAPARSGRE